jgi:tripartite ATP-independent transporter DctP family solute receptor
MNWLFKGLGVGFLASSVLLAAGAAHAADIRERTLKFAFVNVKDHPHGLGAQKFADLVHQKSGGKITVRLFPSGTLGGDSVLLSSVQGGTVEITLMATGVLVGHFKEFVIFDFPFLFNNAEEADAVLDGPFGKKLLNKLPEKGMVGLTYWDHGFRHITNSRRPITKMEDIQGLKIRVPQIPLYIDMFTTLGANATPLPWPELYPALEMEAVDGQENPVPSIEGSKLHEVQKYLSLTRHMYNPLVVLFSERVWGKLTPDERKLLEDAANEAKPYERQVSREADIKALEILKAGGMVVNEVAPAELARMREKLKPVVDKHAQQAGETLVKELFGEIERVRAKN